MSGQIIYASLVPAPKQRDTEDEKKAIEAGKLAKEVRPDSPNKAAAKGYERTLDPEDRRQGAAPPGRHEVTDDRRVDLWP
jgi:hypothetical protein